MKFIAILYFGFSISLSRIAAQNCTTEQFTCRNNRECIPIDFTCDWEDDCEDGSDEFECSNCTVGVGFNCSNSKCIKINYECDGEDDCGDLSDELNCPCDNGFQCKNIGICLPWSYKCDNELDCEDGSDEAGCQCDGFSCNNHLCVAEKCRCDGIDDCSDRSDELNCFPVPKTVVPTGGTNITFNIKENNKKIIKKIYVQH